MFSQPTYNQLPPCHAQHKNSEPGRRKHSPIRRAKKTSLTISTTIQPAFQKTYLEHSCESLQIEQIEGMDQIEQI